VISGSQLGIDDGEPLEGRDIGEPLVGADEMVDGGRSMDPEGHGQLDGVQGAERTSQSVRADEVAGELIVGVQDTAGLEEPSLHVSEEKTAEAGEIGAAQDTGTDLDGERRQQLDRGKPRDEEFRTRLGHTITGMAVNTTCFALYGVPLEDVALSASARLLATTFRR